MFTSGFLSGPLVAFVRSRSLYSGFLKGSLMSVATACASLALLHFRALYGLVAQKVGLSKPFCDSLVGAIKCCCTGFDYFCLL